LPWPAAPPWRRRRWGSARQQRALSGPAGARRCWPLCRCRCRPAALWHPAGRRPTSGGQQPLAHPPLLLAPAAPPLHVTACQLRPAAASTPAAASAARAPSSLCLLQAQGRDRTGRGSSSDRRPRVPWSWGLRCCPPYLGGSWAGAGAGAARDALHERAQWGVPRALCESAAAGRCPHSGASAGRPAAGSAGRVNTS
jgi:hypothetical protein